MRHRDFSHIYSLLFFDWLQRVFICQFLFVSSVSCFKDMSMFKNVTSIVCNEISLLSLNIMLHTHTSSKVVLLFTAAGTRSSFDTVQLL